jgi:hypothetical protein
LSKGLKVSSEKRNVQDLTKEYVVLPIVKEGVEVRQKLYAVLIEIQIDEKISSAISVNEILQRLKINLYQLRKRIALLKYLGYIEDIKIRKTNKHKKTILVSKKGIEKKNDVVKAILFYKDIFKQRFGHYPYITQEEAGILKKLIEELSLEKVLDILKYYLYDTNQFIKENGYRIKFLPTRVNFILTLLNKNEGKLSLEQLEFYKKGKEEGWWSGKEEWAVYYEKQLNEMEQLEKEVEAAKKPEEDMKKENEKDDA